MYVLLYFLARAGHTMNLLGDNLIVCGGRNGGRSSRCLTSVESYSLELGQWTSLTPMRIDSQAMSGVREYKFIPLNSLSTLLFNMRLNGTLSSAKVNENNEIPLNIILVV